MSISITMCPSVRLLKKMEIPESITNWSWFWCSKEFPLEESHWIHYCGRITMEYKNNCTHGKIEWKGEMNGTSQFWVSAFGEWIAVCIVVYLSFTHSPSISIYLSSQMRKEDSLCLEWDRTRFNVILWWKNIWQFFYKKCWKYGKCSLVCLHIIVAVAQNQRNRETDWNRSEEQPKKKRNMHITGNLFFRASICCVYIRTVASKQTNTISCWKMNYVNNYCIQKYTFSNDWILKHDPEKNSINYFVTLNCIMYTRWSKKKKWNETNRNESLQTFRKPKHQATKMSDEVYSVIDTWTWSTFSNDDARNSIQSTFNRKHFQVNNQIIVSVKQHVHFSLCCFPFFVWFSSHRLPHCCRVIISLSWKFLVFVIFMLLTFLSFILSALIFESECWHFSKLLILSSVLLKHIFDTILARHVLNVVLLYQF